jgi:Ser/Thr protein kinase RdoA (MazF antagonist)
VPVGEPITVDGRIYSLFPYIGGQSMRGSDDDRRRRCGRILAELHLDVWSLGIGARPAEPKIVEFAPDQILRHRDALRLALGSADAELFAEHARRVAGNFERLGVRDFPKSIAHRDMSPWNLRFRDGRLSALYDLDHADIDARAADVACGRRGYHDAFVEGYLDVFALSDEELEALGSLWSAHMLGYAARLIAEAMSSDSWNLPELRWCRTQLTKVVPFGQS